MNIVEGLTTALRQIQPEHVHHPYHGYQERVFCYELYHRLRLLQEANELDIHPAQIQAELNKSARHYFRNIVESVRADGDEMPSWRVPEATPDQLVHEPAEGEVKCRNVLALEAKRWPASADHLRWDLAKLTFFAAPPLAYECRTLLVINGDGLEARVVFDRLREFETGGEEVKVCVWTPNGEPEWNSLGFSHEEAQKVFQTEEERRKRRLHGF